MTDTNFSLDQSLGLIVQNAIRKEMEQVRTALMDRKQILLYLGITKEDLYAFINDGLLREGVHWFYLDRGGKKSNRKKYIPEKCLQAILEHHTVSV